MPHYNGHPPPSPQIATGLTPNQAPPAVALASFTLIRPMLWQLLDAACDASALSSTSFQIRFAALLSAPSHSTSNRPWNRIENWLHLVSSRKLQNSVISNLESKSRATSHASQEPGP